MIPAPDPASASTGLATLEQQLGYHFRDRELLTEALTHSSALEGKKHGKSLERLEFFGDRVLGLVIAEALFRAHPGMEASALAPQLSVLVRRAACARAARELGLGQHLLLGKTEEKGGGREKESILADAMEAVIAAIYVDGGLEAARGLILRAWAGPLHSRPREARDPKTILQEWAEGRGKGMPAYRVMGRSGPDHAPRFEIEVRVGADLLARGTGGSKQEAEQGAARALLETSGMRFDDR